MRVGRVVGGQYTGSLSAGGGRVLRGAGAGGGWGSGGNAAGGLPALEHTVGSPGHRPWTTVACGSLVVCVSSSECGWGGCVAGAGGSVPPCGGWVVG